MTSIVPKSSTGFVRGVQMVTTCLLRADSVSSLILSARQVTLKMDIALLVILGILCRMGTVSSEAAVAETEILTVREPMLTECVQVVMTVTIFLLRILV